ncbi:MAG: OmpH family outer membrane protein [Lewinellaceae bacterium]|nr:OmpH family outer membrane protein [Lewinellaceae bacterium]
MEKFSQEKGFTFTNVFDPTNVAIYAKYFVDITPEILCPEQRPHYCR